MLTIRPSPAVRIAVNAVRQQRNEPVRLTPSVCSQISEVMSANGAGVSTPAAQTRAAGGPATSTAANKRSTSLTLLTSDGATVASPPAIAGGEEDWRPGSRDRLRRGGSNPPAGAGDDGHPPREPMRRFSHRL